MNKQEKTFEDSLKSIETENYLDRVFYRPIGYRIALSLTDTKITPNIITIISIFFGVIGGILFFPNNIWINLLGFLLLMIANILDCVDGQLARLTGIKSEVGRILDGFAGDLWFIAIYIAIALRNTNDIGASYAWILAVGAGLSNLIQAALTDYYKTAHLYFISIKKGAEFETIDKVRTKYNEMDRGINKVLYWLYLYYTIVQTKITPQLQQLLKRLIEKYGNDFPQEVRVRLRQMSSKVMKYINWNTFNGRSIAMLFAIIIQQLWVYLLFEIVVLNIVLVTSILKHEKYCKNFEI